MVRKMLVFYCLVLVQNWMHSLEAVDLRWGELDLGYRFVYDELTANEQNFLSEQMGQLQNEVASLAEEYRRSPDYPKQGTALHFDGRELSEGQRQFMAGEAKAVKRFMDAIPFETRRKLLYGIARAKILTGGLLEYAATVEAELSSGDRKAIQTILRQDRRTTYDQAAAAITSACKNYNKQIHDAVPPQARHMLDHRLGFSSSLLFESDVEPTPNKWPTLPKTNLLQSIRTLDQPPLSPRVVFQALRYRLTTREMADFLGSANDDWTGPPSGQYVGLFAALAATAPYTPRVSDEMDAAFQVIETLLQSVAVTEESERAHTFRQRLLFIRNKLGQWERGELEFSPQDIDFLVFGSGWTGVDRLPLHAAEFRTIGVTPIKKVDRRAIADLTFATADPLGLDTSLYDLEYSPEQNRFVSERWRAYRLAMQQTKSVRERLELTKELLEQFETVLTPRQLSRIFVHVVRSRGLLYFFSHPVNAHEYGVDRERFFALASAAEQDLLAAVHEQKFLIAQRTWEILSSATQQEILHRTEMSTDELLELATQTVWENFQTKRE